MKFYWSHPHGVKLGSFHVKWTRGPNLTITDFEDILPVTSNTFQTMLCKVSSSDNHRWCTSTINAYVIYVARVVYFRTQPDKLRA